MNDADAAMAAPLLMLLLGVFHGINPGMGWLFAVAIGLQEQSGRAVARSLVPMAVGHGLAIAVVVLAATFLGWALTPDTLRYPVGIILIALGVSRLIRHRHPRWVRMRVGFADLTMWSFLVATAHGAGLMVLPLLLGSSASVEAAAAGAHAHGHAATSAAPTIVATAIHTFGYLTATGLIAWIVYRKLGLALLRTSWFNLDWLWAIALVVAGGVTMLR
jgi:hypothetical protein